MTEKTRLPVYHKGNLDVRLGWASIYDLKFDQSPMSGGSVRYHVALSMLRDCEAEPASAIDAQVMTLDGGEAGPERALLVENFVTLDQLRQLKCFSED